MSRTLLFPSWISLVSLAVTLFVPFGVGLIADTSQDIGNRSNIAQGEHGHFIPPDEWTPQAPAVLQEGLHETRGRESQSAGGAAHRV